jgi:hypothetical protein
MERANSFAPCPDESGPSKNGKHQFIGASKGFFCYDKNVIIFIFYFWIPERNTPHLNPLPQGERKYKE